MTHPQSASGRGTLRRVAAMTRSGLRRYPRAMVRALHRPTVGQAPSRPRPAAADTLPDPGQAPLAASWLGHATVLVQFGRTTVLTDPVFSDRIGMSLGRVVVGLDRRLPLPIDPARLPPIDLILISHAHFDHLDKPTLRRLASAGTTVVTARRTSGLIPSGFGRVIELGWSDRIELLGLRIMAIRPAHWGARTAVDRRRGYNSYVVESPQRRILFAGDTAYTDAFRPVGPVDLALFGIGGYDPWIHAHADPEQVWSMFRAMRARHLMPMHHSTFELSDEHPDEPLHRLRAAAGRDADRLVGAEPGQLWAA